MLAPAAATAAAARTAVIAIEFTDATAAAAQARRPGVAACRRTRAGQEAIATASKIVASVRLPAPVWPVWCGKFSVTHASSLVR